MSSLVSITFLILYIAANISAGMLLLKILPGILKSGSLLYLSLSFAAGQLILSFAWTILGLNGLFSDIYILSFMFLLVSANIVLNKRELKSPFKRNADYANGFRGLPAGMKIIFMLLILIIILDAVAAYIKPPIGDAEAYYMTYPKMLSAINYLIPMPGTYEKFSMMGISSELHFAALLKFCNYHAAKLFVFFNAIASGFVLSGICSRFNIGRTGKIIAWSILFSSTSFTFYISDGKTDLFALLPALAAFYFMLRDGEKSRLNYVIAGLFAGMAVQAKFSYLGSFIPAIFLLFLYLNLRPFSLKNFVKNGFLFLLFFNIALIPQILKNYYLFGEPFAPLLLLNSESGALQPAWFSNSDSLKIILTYPLALVFGKYPMQGGNVSILYLALLPLILLLKRYRAEEKKLLYALTIVSIIGVVVYTVMYPSVFAPRYYLPVLVLLIPLLAYSAEKFMINFKTGFAGLTIIIVVALALSTNFVRHRQLLEYLSSSVQLEAHGSPYCGLYKKLNDTAKVNERVFLYSYYGWHLNKSLLVYKNTKRESELVLSRQNPLEQLDELRSLGFRYLIIDGHMCKGNSRLYKLRNLSKEIGADIITDKFIEGQDYKNISHELKILPADQYQDFSDFECKALADLPETMSSAELNKIRYDIDSSTLANRLIIFKLY